MRRALLAAALTGLAACSSTPDTTTIPLNVSLVYDCDDGSRLVVVDDDRWVHESADGDDLATGTDTEFMRALDRCKP